MIAQLIHQARTIPDSHLTTFARIRETIKSKILNEELYRGLKITWLPFFNNKVKGVRLGELTVVSGPTGSGKTTFLSQLFLDLCQRDIGILWGSFEIRNEVLITQMLNQFSGCNLAKNVARFEYFADRFEKLPLHLMNFYGSTSMEKILATIVYTIEKHNIHVVVLDTLQFMLSEQGEGFKKF
jgi:twinkle protein